MSRGCKICQGKPKRGQRCMFCGFQIKNKRDMDKRELHREECFEAELDALRVTRAKLLKFNMVTTGSDVVDATIIKYLGDWLPPAGRNAVEIVKSVIKFQEEQGVKPTRSMTLDLALEVGLRTSTRDMLYRAVHSHQYEEDDAHRQELANRR